MKIKTKLQLIIICNILLLAGIVSVSLLWQKQAERHYKRQALVMELNQAVFERARLREEYFLYREARSKEQFLLIHKEIGGLLERMSGTFTGLEEKASLIKMMGFHNKIEGFFNQLVRLDQSATVHTAATQALRERITSQMLVNAHSLYGEGLRLLNAANEKTVYQNNLAHLYSTIVFGLLALFIVTFALIIIRSITYPLTRLHKGTEIIAEGNLDYKTNIRTPDEIGQLSTAFDAMTENLKKITVSRDELSKEIEEREQPQTALRDASQFNEQIICSAQEGVIVYGPDLRYQLWNPFMEQLTGIAAGEVLGKHPLEVFPFLREAGVIERLEKTLAGEVQDPIDFPYDVPHSGKSGWASDLSAPLQNTKGEIIGIIGMVSDITERKRAEEALQRSEQRFRGIFDNMNDGLLIRDIKDARVVAVNRKLCEMYGYGPEEFASLQPGALSVQGPAVGRPELERYQRRALEGEPVLFEWEVRRKDSTPLWVEINMKKVSLGDEEYLLSVVRDITGRLEAQAALRESETKLQAIFDTVGTGIIIIDRNTQIIVEANQTAIEMTGLPKERIIGQICHSLVCPAQAGKCPVKDLGQSVDHSERKLLCADGHLKDILKTVYPITIKGRDCYLESFIDISDRLRAEELLKEGEERFHQLFDNMADGVAIYQAIDDGSDFIFVDINRNGQLLSTISRSDAVGKRVTEIFPGVTKIGLLDVFRQVWWTGEAQHRPLTVYEDERVQQWVENYVFKLPSGLIVALYSDTSEKHRAEEAMKLSEEKYRSLVESSSDAIFTLDTQRTITSCNQAYLDLFGYEREEVENRSVRLIHVSDASFDLYGQKAYPVVQKQGTFRTEWDFARKDGTTVHVESVTFAVKEPDGAIKGFAGIIRDITERKRAGAYGEMGREVLQILNEPGDLQDSIPRVLAALKTRTGFDAVGIRLQDGDDFPYFAQKGFSKDFLLTENTLIERATDGGMCRDKDGNVSLECTCGLVISGKTDPVHPLFTPGGSYWTNDSFPLLDIPPGEDPRLHPRNQCMHQGYASMALVPIRNKDRIVGLIQLNDRRKRRFTLATVELLEGIASHIGEALMRKRAEEALRESGERYRALFENAVEGIFQTTPEGRFISANPALAKLFGYDSPQELIEQITDIGGQHYANPEDRKTFRNTLDVEGIIKGFETQLLNKDGNPVWASLNALAVRDDEGVVVYYEGTVEDITQRKRAGEALRESEERYRSLVENTNEAIYVVQDGMLKFANRAGAEIAGYSEQEIISKPFIELIHPDDRAMVRELYLRFLRGERFDSPDTFRFIAKNGNIKWLEMGTALMDFEGRLATLSVATDITDRKRAEEELARVGADLREANSYLEEATARANDMAGQAEMASAAKSEFLANMSHEIRTPMNGVIGMTGLLLDTELDHEQRRYAEIVRASGESLLGLINDILDFSKMEAKKLDVETLDFDLSSLLDDFAATLAVQAHEKGLELLCATDAAVPTLLRGDPGRLRQILTNLAGNAVKFTHAGEVAVRVSLVETHENDVLLRFSVRDTGIGIPADKIGLLFDKFSQVDASTSRQYGGTGLGLAISKQLAELMGGEAGVKSEEGKGSEFWFTARLGTQAEGAQAESRPPAHLRYVRALIVDDNATSREILTTHLISWGMWTSEAQDGPGALQALYRALDENDPFRIAVIDMQMPGMDGEALGRTIKADERLADTRMVMLTSLGTRGDARHFQEIGFAAYATKPIRHQELKAVLSLALTDRDGAKPTPRPDPQDVGSGPVAPGWRRSHGPTVTRHTARETLNLFAGRKARILLAEDNITNQQVALGILKKLGLRADAVANGAEAVKALETLPYDLVLMDVQMPEMDGFEATREIRNPQSAIPNRRIPIIAMTAHAMQGDRERCLEAGMNDYVAKPVSPQALAEVLDKWLPKENAECGIMNAGKRKRRLMRAGALHHSSPITHH